MNPEKVSGRTRISLDQCFLSRLAIRRKRDVEFDRLLNALRTAVSRKKIVCPAHALETIYESAKLRNATDTRKVVNLQNELSHGFAFHCFFELLALTMLQMVRPRFAFQDLKYRPIKLPCNAELQSLKKRLETMDKRQESMASRINYHPQDYGKGFPELLAEIEREREDSMRQILKSVSKGSPVPIPSKADWTAGVGNSLLGHHANPTECKAMEAIIDNGRWRQIDVLKIHSILFAKIEEAMLAPKPKEWQLSDHPDISKLSVSLLCANIATCDNPMRDVIKQTKVEKNSSATVFSINEPLELAKFVQAL